MVNLVADYLEAGQFKHQAFQLVGSDDKELAARSVFSTLRAQGCEVAMLTIVHGDMTFEALNAVGDSPVEGAFEVVYLDSALLR